MAKGGFQGPVLSQLHLLRQAKKAARVTMIQWGLDKIRRLLNLQVLLQVSLFKKLEAIKIRNNITNAKVTSNINKCSPLST